MKIFFGISSFQVLAMFRRGLFYSFLTIYLRHFLGLSVTATTLYTTLPMIANVAAQRWLWGGLSDRLQKRRFLVVWGELLAGVGTILLFYAHRVPEQHAAAGWVLIWGLTLIELFWSMSNIGWSALIADVFKKGERSRIMGQLESMGGMGRILGVLCGGLLYDNMGKSFSGWGFYEGSLFWISGVVMFVSVLPMFLVPEGGVRPSERTPEQSLETDGPKPGIFITFILAITLIHFGRNSISVTLPQYLSLDSGLGLSALTLSHVVNIRSAGIILAGLFAGWLCRKIGDRSALAVSSILAALAMIIMGVSVNLAWICVSSFLMGVSEVMIIASSYELASSYIPPETRGTGFALFNATFFLSWGLGATFLAGPITDGLMAKGVSEARAYMASFNAGALLVVAGILALFVLFRMESRPHSA